MAKACAILAAEAVTALGPGLDTVWAAMMARTTGIRPLHRFTHGRYATDYAAELPPEVEEVLDPVPGGRPYRWALHVARRVLPRADRERTGLLLSTTKADLAGLESAVAQSVAPQPHYNPFCLARDLSRALGLHGPAMAVSNACASGLVAVAQAARWLERRDADYVVVVGVDVLADFILAGFSNLAALSPEPCRPFDRDRRGLTLGEGASALLLARPELAQTTPKAFVAGWSVTCDAHHMTAPAPDAGGLRRAMCTALGMAALAPHDIHYVNAHGTGTLYNDRMEMAAASAVLGPHRPPMTSMKGYIGHTLGAAGVIETALCLKAMAERRVPANLGLRQLPDDTPLDVPVRTTTVQPLQNVLTMKSGFGGINAAVVLTAQEPPP